MSQLEKENLTGTERTTQIQRDAEKAQNAEIQ